LGAFGDAAEENPVHGGGDIGVEKPANDEERPGKRAGIGLHPFDGPLGLGVRERERWVRRRGGAAGEGDGGEEEGGETHGEIAGSIACANMCVKWQDKRWKSEIRNPNDRMKTVSSFGFRI